MQVVIIGAGVSGLSCAARLAQLSSVQITILEATDRIGGRVKSVNFSGTCVDIGASWLHETRHNPLFQLGLDKGWPMKFTDELMKFGTEKGELPQKNGIKPILKDLESRISELSSAKQFDEKDLESFVKEQIFSMSLITERQKQLASVMMRENEHFIGLPISKIPALDGCFHNDLGRDAFVMGRGLQLVVEWLTENIDWSKTKLHLQTPVINVTHKERRFSVNHTSGSIEADFVVCTVPLGTLKSQFTQLFCDVMILPNLDFRSMAAIQTTVNQTSVAQLGKIIVQFETRFWDLNAKVANTDSWFLVNEQNGECLTIVNPFVNDAILVILIGPPLTKRYEKMNEYELFSNIKWAFESMVNSQSARQHIDKVTRVEVSDWSTNPYFQGSYSARTLHQTYNQMIDPYIYNTTNLRFAGEHTILEGNGCVHGAYNSGIREAEFIANVLGN